MYTAVPPPCLSLCLVMGGCKLSIVLRFGLIESSNLVSVSARMLILLTSTKCVSSWPWPALSGRYTVYIYMGYRNIIR